MVTTGVRSDVAQRVEAVRRFNRFYTKQIGVLHEGLLQSPFSLTEARVLYELAHRGDISASELAKDLGLDAGYLSRILRRFEYSGFLDRTPSPTDGRRSQLRLTQQGRDAFAPLDQRSHDEVAALLSKLSETEQERLLDAMQAIE
ncbi:MAG TPA: MarR family winged helix-turn-helix transcriptional regulator, partial [Ktedonobacterales bacterium]